MEFKLVQQIVKNIQDTVTNSVIGSSRALMKHTFPTKIVNFPKIQKVNGVVSISNQKRVEKELKKSTIVQKSVLKWLKSFKLPTKMEISNFPSAKKQLPYPTKMEVSNFPKSVEAPKNIRVSNQPTKEIKALGELLKQVKTAIGGLKLDPTIKVQAAKADKVIVPPANVSVTQQEIDYEKLASLIPVADDFDYDKLSKAVAKEIADMVVSIGGGGSGGNSNGFRERDGKPGRALVDSKGRIITHPDYFIADKEIGALVTYTGNESFDGYWYMMKVSGDEIRYASSQNNEAYSNYAAAWEARASLEYGYPSEVDF